MRRSVFGVLVLTVALLAQSACGGLPWAGASLDLPHGAGHPRYAGEGFNLFTPEQDVELGQMTAREYAARLRLVADERVTSYVQRLGDRLAEHAPGYGFRYEFVVVGSGDVNAFALPGGFVFVNAGAIAQAETEGELAGVLAHEIAHVALRHGTNQASKAYLARAGLGAVEKITGGDRNAVGKLVNSLGSAGAELAFLKFSRSAEAQADLEGARMLAAAGYDPREMTDFFARLGARGVERRHELLSDHPDPAARVASLERLTRTLTVVPRPAGDAVEFTRVKARLSNGGLWAAPPRRF